MRQYFNEDELKIMGEYPSGGGFFGKPQPSYPIYNHPVTPRENFDLLING